MPTPTGFAQQPWHSDGQLPEFLVADLKAENVLLTTGSDGRLEAKLCDFGLHKLDRRLPNALTASSCTVIR